MVFENETSNHNTYYSYGYIDFPWVVMLPLTPIIKKFPATFRLTSYFEIIYIIFKPVIFNKNWILQCIIDVKCINISIHESCCKSLRWSGATVPKLVQIAYATIFVLKLNFSFRHGVHFVWYDFYSCTGSSHREISIIMRLTPVTRESTISKKAQTFSAFSAFYFASKICAFEVTFVPSLLLKITRADANTVPEEISRWKLHLSCRSSLCLDNYSVTKANVIIAPAHLVPVNRCKMHFHCGL